jgi:hypothetical protein
MGSIWPAAHLLPHHTGEITDTFLTVFCQKLKSAVHPPTTKPAIAPIFSRSCTPYAQKMRILKIDVMIF